MSTDSLAFLDKYLQCVADDALFCVTSTLRMDGDVLGAAAERRAEMYHSIAQGNRGDSADYPSWCVNMSAALAPVAPIWWLCTHELIQSLSLQTGARGVRSLFTSKPSDKQVERTRTTGSFVVRALTSVMGCDEPLSDDNELLRRCIVSALGIPAPDSDHLNQENPKTPEEIQPVVDLEPKIAKYIATSLWRVAFRDGLKPQQDERVLALCSALKIPDHDVESLRKQAQSELYAQQQFGLAAVDACRYVLADEQLACSRYAHLVAMLTLAPTHRANSIAEINYKNEPTLAKRHSLDKRQRVMCLAIAWFAALATNPNQTHLARFSARHLRIASDFGDAQDSATAIKSASDFVLHHLVDAVQSAGS